VTVLLNITTVPQDFAAGTFNTAASAINAGKWRITLTPAGASTTYTGGNFHAILGQEDGGLWFNDRNLELYTTPGNDLAFSIALTWSANQPITLVVDAQSGHMTATISGATTGNGTVSLAFPGPYLDPTLLLETGHQSGGTNFQYVGGISPVDDGTAGGASDSVTPAAISIASNSIGDKRTIKDAITPAAISIASNSIGDKLAIKDTVTPASVVLAGSSAIGDKLAIKDTVTPASVVLAGGNIVEGRSGNSDVVSPATVVISGQAIPEKRTYADAVFSASINLTGRNVIESQGGTISLGSTSIDFQRFGFANRRSSVSVNTPASGAVVLLSAGGKSSDVSTPWTDSVNTATPVVIGNLVEYPDYPGYGTIITVTPAPMTGSTGQTFTQQVTTDDENTTFALTAIVAGGHPRITEVHNNVANGSGTTQQTSPSINIDGEALLVAYWWGAAPVNPPFSSPSPGVGTPYTAVPNNGFTVVQSYLVNNEFGEVEAAMAYLYVPAGAGPSTRSVTWTHSPAQGAQLRLVAIQPALSEAITQSAITVVGQPIGDVVSFRDMASPGGLSISGSSVTDVVGLSDRIVSAAITITGGTVQARRTSIDVVSPTTIPVIGGLIQDQVANNIQDIVLPATVALAGTSVGDRITNIDIVEPTRLSITGGQITGAWFHRDIIQPSTLVLAGGNTLAAVARRANVQPATTTVQGGQVTGRTERKDSTNPGTVTIVGGQIHDQASTGISDAVTPATVLMVGLSIAIRVARSVSIETAILALRGTDVQESTSSSDVITAAPPGRAPERLEGRVVIPFVESSASELQHLYGVIKGPKNVE